MHSAGNYVHPIDQGLGSTIAAELRHVRLLGHHDRRRGLLLQLADPVRREHQQLHRPQGHARNNNSQLGGPASVDTVMCLSCHRAHASAFPEALRWYEGNEFITRADTSTGLAAYPGNDVPGFMTNSQSIYTAGRSVAMWTAGYYGRPAAAFGAGGFQRQLCNKCHAKD